MSDTSGPTSNAELREALHDLLVAARENGVRVTENRWVINNHGTDAPHWEVEVVPVADSHDEE